MTFYCLFFSNLIHQLVDLIQQEQAPLGVLGPGDPDVDAAGDLVDVYTDFVDFPTKVLDLLDRLYREWNFLNKPDEVGPPGEAALLGLGHQPLVLRRRQFDVDMMPATLILGELPLFSA